MVLVWQCISILDKNVNRRRNVGDLKSQRVFLTCYVPANNCKPLSNSTFIFKLRLTMKIYNPVISIEIPLNCLYFFG